MLRSGGRAFQAGGTARAEALRQAPVWCVVGTARPVWLEQCGQRGEKWRLGREMPEKIAQALCGCCEGPSAFHLRAVWSCGGI